MTNLTARRLAGVAAVIIPAAAVMALFIALGLLEPVPAVIIGMTVLAASIWVSFRLTPRSPHEFVPPEDSIDTLVAATILDSLPDPILLLSEDRIVLSANGAAQNLLGTSIRDRDLSLSLRHPEALEAVNCVLRGEPCPEATITFPVPVERIFEIHAAPLPLLARGSAHAVLVLHNITAIKAAEDMRANFVANVSHELRSPLSSLVGFIETLKGAAKDDPAARERFLDIMDGEANRMARLIGDLLSLSKVEANEHIQPDESVELSQLLRETTDTLSKRAQEKDTEIHIDCPQGLAPITGSRDELTEVFHNLIDNAIKYGKEGGRVGISVTAVERIPETGNPGLAVAISDSGDGIPLEHIPRLTERFYRIDKGRSRSMGGTGLGLAIVKHIVNRHRGRLIIDSTLGAGSTFTVFLPVEV
ncbi:MAG: PAS domain-containing protein [Rhodospirillales bacterium]|nr:PAS domain-containing protein [Rhodospirillales bacterium]